MARSLLEPTPTFTVKPNVLFTWSLSRVAMAMAFSGVQRRLISMKHSSILNCCSTGLYERHIVINPSEQRLYHSQSPRTSTRVGQVRSAIETGCAVFMPSFLAGMDAAVMMLRRSLGSPDTTDGTSRMSGFPSITSFTALQLRNAEFTSI